MPKPHKHAEIIKAWADGAQIEVFSKILKKWTDCYLPEWRADYLYRVKVEQRLSLLTNISVSYYDSMTSEYKNTLTNVHMPLLDDEVLNVKIDNKGFVFTQRIDKK